GRPAMDRESARTCCVPSRTRRVGGAAGRVRGRRRRAAARRDASDAARYRDGREGARGFGPVLRQNRRAKWTYDRWFRSCCFDCAGAQKSSGVRVTFLANPQTSPPADARAGRDSRFSAGSSVRECPLSSGMSLELGRSFPGVMLSRSSRELGLAAAVLEETKRVLSVEW